MLEKNIFKRAMMRACKFGSRLFRVNSGRAWTGNDIRKNPDGSITIMDPRPFKTGVPKGFSDAIGWTSKTITPDMVGLKIAIFTAMETKTKTGRATKEQVNFMNQVACAGGISGIVRCDEDVDQLLSDNAASPASAK